MSDLAKCKHALRRIVPPSGTGRECEHYLAGRPKALSEAHDRI
jgi:hypothetical protein